MIDWPHLFFNALWILALAILLAVFSYASWQASLQQAGWREQLSTPGAIILLNLSGLLFCAGLAGSAGPPWQTVIWALLAVFFAVGLLLAVKRGVIG